MVDEKELNRFMLTMTIIWCALLFSLLVYLFVGLYVVKSSQHTGAADTFANIRIILYIMSLIMLFITNPVRKLIINKNALSSRQQTWKRPEFQKYSTAMIVASAMSESIGIYGLVLYLLGHNVFDLYVLIAVSAAAMLRYRPKRDEVLGLIEAGSTGKM